MKATNLSPSSITSTNIEDESFWHQHCQEFQASGLSGKEYCRLNVVNYDRFGYFCDSRSSHLNRALLGAKYP